MTGEKACCATCPQSEPESQSKDPEAWSRAPFSSFTLAISNVLLLKIHSWQLPVFTVERCFFLKPKSTKKSLSQCPFKETEYRWILPHICFHIATLLEKYQAMQIHFMKESTPSIPNSFCLQHTQGQQLSAGRKGGKGRAISGLFKPPHSALLFSRKTANLHWSLISLDFY